MQMKSKTMRKDAKSKSDNEKKMNETVKSKHLENLSEILHESSVNQLILSQK